MRKLYRYLSIALIMVILIPTIKVNAYEDNTIGTGEKYKRVKARKYSAPFNSEKTEGYIPQEVQDKLKILNNEMVLQPLTDNEYEIALAYEDGSFELVEGTNNLEEAMKKSDDIGLIKKSGQSTVGAVINKYGYVIYSPNGVGRVRKVVSGSVDTSNRVNSDIYTTSGLAATYTYINHAYVEDVALIEQVGTTAKIQFSASVGWIRTPDSAGNGDLVVLPITQYKNPSYYYSQAGILYHFISNNIESDTKKGSTVTLGPAPKELVEGKKYLSFDGVFFYEITTNAQAYINLITDLQSSPNNQRAVNGNNPYYNYYNYLPFRTQSLYTAEQLDMFIEQNTKDKPTSKLKGLGKALKESEEKYGVNAILTLGVAVNESGWGTSKISQEKNNLFGIRAYDSDPTGSSIAFATPGDSVIGFTKHYISKGYCDPNDWRAFGSILGNKETGVNVKYASDPYWGEKASGLAFRIDYHLAGKNVSNLKDFNNYQLAMVTGPNTIYNESGQVLLSVGNSKVTSQGTLKSGAIVPLSSLYTFETSRGKEYKINPDRKDVISLLGITGDYDFNVKGYLGVNNTKLINKAKENSPIYIKEDINGDGKIDIQDLTNIANLYNTTSSESKWNNIFDLNNDGIIDLFDLVRVSRKM